MKQNKIFKSIFSVMGLVVVAKLIGFIKQIVISFYYGANIETDIYNLSIGFVSNIEYVLTQTLTTAFITTYIHISNNKDTSTKSFSGDVLKIFITISFTISCIFAVFSNFIAKILAPSYSKMLQQNLSESITFFGFSLIFISVIAVFMAMLEANKIFQPSQMIGLNQSIVTMLMIIGFNTYIGINTLYYSHYIQLIVNVCFLLWWARKYLYISKSNPLKNIYVRRLLKTMLPLFLGYSAIYINEQVDKILASGMETGTVTAMSYAAILNGLIGTLIASLCTMFYSYVTSYITKGKKELVGKLTETVTLGAVLGMIPIMIVMFLCSQEIVGIIFGRGKFGEKEIIMTSYALQGYAVGFLGLALKSIYARVQYSYGDTKKPMIYTTMSICLNIVLSVALYKKMGVFGITFSTSIATYLDACLNMLASKKKNEHIVFSSILKKIIYIIILTMVNILLINKVIFEIFSIHGFAKLLVVASIVFGSFASFTVIMLRTELNGTVKKINFH